MTDSARRAEKQARCPADAAIPRLLEQHGARLYWLGIRLCGSHEEAEDLVQETFLQAYRKWHQFQGRSDPHTWLFTIASRVCRRMHRRRAGEPQEMASLADLLPMKEAEPAVMPADSQLSRAIRRESREELEQAIAALPMRFRMPLVLRDIVELSPAEIAAILGLKEATVKTRIHRARLRLRESVQRHLPRRKLPPPAYSRQVCLDLLRAKQEAMDRDVAFPVGEEVLCERCQALFQTLDFTRDLCREIAEGRLPEAVRRAVLRRLEDQGPAA